MSVSLSGVEYFFLNSVFKKQINKRIGCVKKKLIYFFTLAFSFLPVAAMKPILSPVYVYL